MKSLKSAIVASFLLISAQSYTFSSNLSDIEPEEIKKHLPLSQLRPDWSQLPSEFKIAIFSYLNQKDLIRLSHTNRDSRLLAYSPELNNIINLSDRNLTNEDCFALMKAPFSSLILRSCHLSDQSVAIIVQSCNIDQLPNKINLKDITVLNVHKFRAIKSLDLSNNYITSKRLSWVVHMA